MLKCYELGGLENRVLSSKVGRQKGEKGGKGEKELGKGGVYVCLFIHIMNLDIYIFSYHFLVLRQQQINEKSHLSYIEKRHRMSLCPKSQCLRSSPKLFRNPHGWK